MRERERARAHARTRRKPQQTAAEVPPPQYTFAFRARVTRDSSLSLARWPSYRGRRKRRRSGVGRRVGVTRGGGETEGRGRRTTSGAKRGGARNGRRWGTVTGWPPRAMPLRRRRSAREFCNRASADRVLPVLPVVLSVVRPVRGSPRRTTATLRARQCAADAGCAISCGMIAESQHLSS